MSLRDVVSVVGVAALAVGMTNAASAATETFDFYRISDNSADTGTAANLKVDVSDDGVGPNQVAFTFYWAGSPSGSIAEVYFDDGTLLGIAAVDDSDPGVSFNNGGSANPPELPEGNNFMINGTGPYQFQTTAGFLADADPGNASAVQLGESLTIIFDLIGGQSFADVIDAMNSAWTLPPGDSTDPITNTGGLVIGVHVRAQSDGESDSFITVPGEIIPLPMTFGLGMAGLAPLALRRRRTL
ncbi:MAG: hypothetical protein ACF8GE_12270 [Phycisphaerales bacterium JB043]